jgi:hypothetical protein
VGRTLLSAAFDFHILRIKVKKRKRVRPISGEPGNSLLVIELAAQDFIATATTAVLPFHLDQPIVSAKRLVVGALAEPTCDRAELPGAFVRTLVAGGVVPAVQVGIGTASEASCAMIEAIPSAPLSPFGLTICISQADGQRSGLPTNANLMSAPPMSLLLCHPQYLVQKPEVSATSDAVSTKYKPLASFGRARLLMELLTMFRTSLSESCLPRL